MTGFVDDQLRALLPVPVSPARNGNRTEILAWIDTAFNGGLALLFVGAVNPDESDPANA